MFRQAWEKGTEMTFGLIVIEGLVVCFIVLLCCVIGIANGPQGMAFFYEKEVQERAIAGGLITKEALDRNLKRFKLIGMGIMFVFILLAVYGLNGARGFLEGFWQILAVLMIEGVFDRIFIDWYWVCCTRAWVIQGTEDMQPYISKKVFVKKWVMTLIGFPAISAILSGIMCLFLK